MAMTEDIAAPTGVDPYGWIQLSAFRRRVYRRLCDVPVGKVTTYVDLGRAVGCGSPRAVGQALRHNPFAPRVPCHRVIASDLRIGGFRGESDGAQVARKRAMLKAEGVEFDDDGTLRDRGCLDTLTSVVPV